MPENLIHFLISGGIFMVPLIICSLVSLAFILERGLALRRSKVVPGYLRNEVVNLRSPHIPTELEKEAAAGKSTLARLIQICLEHREWSRDENVEAIQSIARSEVVELERGLVILEIIAGIGPLLGLLGTLSGLIAIFASVGKTGVSDQGLLLAKGISEALNTTVGGLIVAIPALVFYSYYSRKVESMGVELERICIDLVKKIYGPAGAIKPAGS